VQPDAERQRRLAPLHPLAVDRGDSLPSVGDRRQSPDARLGHGVDRIVRGLRGEGFYVDREAALEAERERGQFNAIDPEGGWKVDLIVRKDRPYSRVEFDRRARVTLLGVELWIASLEDVLIAKLEWSRLGDSALQRRDVRQLLERTSDRLDRPYVERWVEELALQSDWNRALGEVFRDESE